MKYKINYHGYVYEWHNTATNKKYIGSHYGSVEDCYKGSGVHFRSAYKKNPEHFIMTVLEYVEKDDKKEVLAAEQRWLSSIEDIKNNPNYYNLSNVAGGGWHHLTEEQKKKRINSLIVRQSKVGLTEVEKSSYKQKIKTRLARIDNTGFTEKEKKQHAKYGYQVQVTMPSGDVRIYDSCGQATRELGIDVQYGLIVCTKKVDFKGYKMIKLKDPITDCRKRN